MGMPDLQTQVEQLRVVLVRAGDLIEAILKRLQEVKNAK